MTVVPAVDVSRGDRDGHAGRRETAACQVLESKALDKLRSWGVSFAGPSDIELS